MKIKLDNRLLTVASLVREGAVLADVGTDHAYIPIYLMQNGKIKFAVASDINEGPLLAAKKNVSENGLAGKIELVLCDGLNDIFRFNPTDIVIAGMGGELICKIISDSMREIRSDKGIRLILQPMTHQAEVRRFLYENGFNITDEKVVTGDRRIYQIMCAEVSNEVTTISDIEALLGRVNIMRGGSDFVNLCNLVIGALTKTAEGKAKANLNFSNEARLISEIKNLPTYQNEI